MHAATSAAQGCCARPLGVPPGCEARNAACSTCATLCKMPRCHASLHAATPQHSCPAGRAGLLPYTCACSCLTAQALPMQDGMRRLQQLRQLHAAHCLHLVRPCFHWWHRCAAVRQWRRRRVALARWPLWYHIACHLLSVCPVGDSACRLGHGLPGCGCCVVALRCCIGCYGQAFVQ